MDGQISGQAKVLRAPSLKRGKPEERITDRVIILSTIMIIFIIIGYNDLHMRRKRPCYFRDAASLLYLHQHSLVVQSLGNCRDRHAKWATVVEERKAQGFYWNYCI